MNKISKDRQSSYQDILNDLDNEILEIYLGYNKQQVPEEQRFYKKGEKDYYSVKLKDKIPFSEFKIEYFKNAE